MRPVNLIPPEDQRGTAPSGSSGVIGYLIIGVLVAAIAIFGYMTLLGNKIDDHEAEIANLESRTQESQARVAALAPYVQLASVKEARMATIDSLAKSRFDWERVLRELARVTPGSISLSSMTGTVSPSVDVEGGADVPLRSQAAGPALEIDACASNQRKLADFITALHDIDGVTRVAVQASNRPERQQAEEAAATSDSAAPQEGMGECARPKDTKFQLVAAFDAVPAPSDATGSTGAVPVTTSTTDDGGVAAAQESQGQEQQAISNASQNAEQATNLAPGG